MLNIFILHHGEINIEQSGPDYRIAPEVSLAERILSLLLHAYARKLTARKKNISGRIASSLD
jgi:hypothetical protein